MPAGPFESITFVLVILPASGIAWSCLFEIPPIKGLFFVLKLLWTLLLGSAHHQFITEDQTTMDPVKTQHGLSSQSRSGLLGQHEQLICTVSENSARIMQHFDALSQQDTFLSTKVATLVSASATCDGVAASHTPSLLMGTWQIAAASFSSVTWCSSSRPLSFATDSAKVNYAIGLLREEALMWAQAMSSRQQISSLTYDDLESRLKGIFDHPNYSTDATHRLMSIEQDACMVAEYTVGGVPAGSKQTPTRRSGALWAPGEPQQPHFRHH